MVFQTSSRVVLGLAVLLAVGSLGWAAQPYMGDRLLPDTTKGALMVTNVEQLNGQWDQTQIGQLMAQPVMEPFLKDARRQLQERFARLRERLGITLDDMRGVPTGELDVAVIQPAEDQAAVALLMDVAGHLPQAREMLDKVSANLTRQGGKKTPHKVGSVTLLLFDMPKTEEYPAGQVVYFLDEAAALLGAADNIEVVKDILRRRAAAAGSGAALGDLPAFQHVMARCQRHAGRGMPQIRWFVEPMGYSKAMRILTPKEKRREGTSVVDVLRNQGFHAAKGVGGFIDLAATVNGNPFEVVHRTAIYAPGPFEKAPAPYKKVVPMEMFTFPNSRSFVVSPLVPNDVAKCTMFNWDLVKAFDNCASTIDTVFGEGDSEAESDEERTSIWYDVLEGLRTDEDGPRIDLRDDLVVHLGQRVTVMSDYLPEITPKCERLLFTVKIKPGAAPRVATTLGKWLHKDDPTVEIRQWEGITIWETVEPKRQTRRPPPNVSLPRPGQRKAINRRAQRFNRGGKQRKNNDLLPNRAVMVHGDHLLIASHIDFLIEVLNRSKTPAPLAGSTDYRLVNSKLAALGAGDDCLHAFSRTDEEFRPIYELTRQGKMPEAQTMFARMLNGLFGTPERGVARKPEFDGSQMPDYEVIRPALGPAGTYGRTESDGWFVVGFMLKK